MSSNILFITASIRSHVMPAMYLADALNETYNCVFATTDDILKELVEKNGYKSVTISNLSVLISGMEEHYISTIKRLKINLLNYVSTLYKNELFEYKKKELSGILHEFSPSLVVIDIFRSTEYFVLKAINPTIKIVFFNPMLSIYRVKNYPIVSEGEWPKFYMPNSTFKKQEKLSIKNGFLRYLRNKSRANILMEAQVEKKQLDDANNFTLMIKDVPELIAAPLELEFSEDVKQNYQHYLGLCTREGRIDTEMDEDFSQNWESICGSGKEVIYCSFGTFYKGADRPLLDFLMKLSKLSIEMPQYIWVVSVNKWVIQSLNINVDNLYFFTKVPQLEVLKRSALFITHGGLGSVKEAIEYTVPMLVYPLDMKYDQNGNGFKVEYHGIGLRGNFTYERYEDLKSKIRQLLKDKSFKNNITALRMEIQEKYKEENILEALNKVIA